MGDEENLFYAKSIEDCLKNADLCFIATPWDEFRAITADVFKKNMKTPAILDAWSLYDFQGEEKISYRAIGKNYRAN